MRPTLKPQKFRIFNFSSSCEGTARSNNRKYQPAAISSPTLHNQTKNLQVLLSPTASRFPRTPRDHLGDTGVCQRLTRLGSTNLKRTNPPLTARVISRRPPSQPAIPSTNSMRVYKSSARAARNIVTRVKLFAIVKFTTSGSLGSTPLVLLVAAVLTFAVINYFIISKGKDHNMRNSSQHQTEDQGTKANWTTRTRGFLASLTLTVWAVGTSWTSGLVPQLHALAG